MISERLEAPDAVRHQHELALRAQEFVPLTAHNAQTLRHLDAAASWGVDEIARRDSWIDAAIRSDEVSEPFGLRDPRGGVADVGRVVARPGQDRCLARSGVDVVGGGATRRDLHVAGALGGVAGGGTRRAAH